jgi:small subunit ribosomal protein S2
MAVERRARADDQARALSPKRELDKLMKSLGRDQGHERAARRVVRRRVGYHKIGVNRSEEARHSDHRRRRHQPSPDGIAYVIPSNDSSRAIRLYAAVERVLEGKSTVIRKSSSRVTSSSK